MFRWLTCLRTGVKSPHVTVSPPAHFCMVPPRRKIKAVRETEEERVKTATERNSEYKGRAFAWIVDFRPLPAIQDGPSP
eukprot:3063749-Rhodomonas_salina.1